MASNEIHILRKVTAMYDLTPIRSTAASTKKKFARLSREDKTILGVCATGAILGGLVTRSYYKSEFENFKDAHLCIHEKDLVQTEETDLPIYKEREGSVFEIMFHNDMPTFD